MMMTIGAALRAAEAALSAVSDSARLDARLLLEHVLRLDRAALVAHPERPLPPEAHARLMALVDRAVQGEPIPYLTGRRAFFRHEFAVSPDVLIPRPETEHLVEAALVWAEARSPGGVGLTLVDVGTGSGAIAVSLAAALSAAAVYALDISPAALAVARRNAQAARIDTIRFAQSDLLAALPAGVRPDLIAANLPYIPSMELAGLDVVKYEPALALDGGPDGLDLIRALVAQAAPRLATPGCLLLEIGAGQGAAVAALCRQAFPGGRVRVIDDYAGHDRVVEVVR